MYFITDFVFIVSCQLFYVKMFTMCEDVQMQ